MNADVTDKPEFPPSSTTSPAEGAPPSEGRSPEETLAAAQAAFADIVQNVQTRLQEVDVVTWARRHPWLAVGISAATGFVAASALSSSRRPVPPNSPGNTGNMLGDVLAELQKPAAVVPPPGTEPNAAQAPQTRPPAEDFIAALGPASANLLTSVLDALRQRLAPAAPVPAADDCQQHAPAAEKVEPASHGNGHAFRESVN